MTQRYTKLGHKHHSSKNEKLVVKNTRTFQKNGEIATVETEEEKMPVLATVSNDNNLAGSQKPVFLPKKLVQPLVSSGNKAFTAITADYKKSRSENLSQEKTFKQKAHSAAGLLNTVFKIVLFAIILAILVAVIIIIILT